MNLTQAKRKANLAAWKSTPPAVIKSPLKRIHEVYPDRRDIAGVVIGMHPIYADAYRSAQSGLGRYVQLQAQALT